MTHLGTRVLNRGDDECLSRGQTLWGEASEARSAGVAWDWVQLPIGVVAMSDPLGLVTNLEFLDDHGDTLTSSQLALQLHQLVRELPWQDEVVRALHDQVEY